MRLCPKCGKKTQEARCPEDGTATLVLAANPDSRLTEGIEINGRYRIREMIGQGGFGAVYKATNIATDQDMAIKLLAVSLDSDDADMVQRFFAEAQVTASLKHPNTIRVFDFGQTEGGALYIAMELLSGKSLNDLMKLRGTDGKVLTEDETINIGVQVLRSLAEAHLANLVHRDLKPHNIFLHEVEGDDPVVKVLDFGIAKRLGSNMTGTGKAFGTPSYMSPEQAQNKKVDRRSDLYSLGCVLYQCVSGHTPFEGDNPLAVLLSHVTDTAPDLRIEARTAVSDSFIRVLERALSKDPNDRFSSAIEMRQALEAARGSEKTETPRMTGLDFQLPQDGTIERTAGYDTGAAGSNTNAAEPRTAAYLPAATPRPTPNRGSTPTGGGPDAFDEPGPTMMGDVVQPDLLGAGKGRKGPGGAPSGIGTAPNGPAPIQVAQPGAQTMAFLGRAAELGLTPAEPEAAATPPTKKKGVPVLALVVAGLVVAGGALAVLLAGGEEPAQDAAAVLGQQQAGLAAAETPSGAASGTAGAAAQPPAPNPPQQAQTAEATAAPGAGADAVTAPDAASEDQPVTVTLASTPPGAAVSVAGKEVGKTPMPLMVVGNAKLDVVLRLQGHVLHSMTIDRGDAPERSVTLVADPTAQPKTSKASKPPSSKQQAPSQPKTKSALEERL
jgi:serine/threonine-protein kinase